VLFVHGVHVRVTNHKIGGANRRAGREASHGQQNRHPT
jgi:hypothetical protein